MISIRPLVSLSMIEIERVTDSYTSYENYQVSFQDSEQHTRFDIELIPLIEPYTARYDHFDNETLDRYRAVLTEGFSFGAYEGDELVGFLIAEKRDWNSSLWVWEFHVSGAYRRQGIGRRLMEQVVLKSRSEGLRTIVCETQNRNAPAIHAYRALGFMMEGIDISYYTNNDYPDRGIAVFMKKRL